MAKTYAGISGRTWSGLMLIALSALLYYFRPFQGCAWYNLICQASGAVTSMVIIIICFILLIVGVWRLITK